MELVPFGGTEGIRVNRLLIVSAVLVTALSLDVRADEIVPAVYQRTSTRTAIARANWARHGGNWGWGYPGFYNPWFAPQAFAGTWNQRPYPDHLIFNNVRSGAPPMQGVPVDYPCLEPPAEQAISP